LVRKFEYFKEFKDYHDHQYKIVKGEKNIWIEFALFILSFLLVLFSFYKVSKTNPGEVSDNDIWKVYLPDELSENQKTEYLTLLFERREEILHDNRNFISRNSSETSNNTDSKYKLIKFIIFYVIVISLFEQICI